MEEIQRIIRSYFKNLYSIKLEHLKEMNNFLDRYNLPKLSQIQMNKWNGPITSKEIEAVVKIPKSPRARLFRRANTARAWQIQRQMLAANRWTENEVPIGGLRERFQGTEGVCNPIRTTIPTTLLPDLRFPYTGGVQPWQDQRLLLPLVPNKAILCYICSWSHGFAHGVLFG